MRLWVCIKRQRCDFYNKCPWGCGINEDHMPYIKNRCEESSIGLFFARAFIDKKNISSCEAERMRCPYTGYGIVKIMPLTNLEGN